MERWTKETDNQLWETTNSRVLFLLPVFPIVGMFTLDLTVYQICIDVAQYNSTLVEAVLGNIMYILLSIFLLYLAYAIINYCLVKYRFEAEGIRVKYPLRRSFVVSWSQFQQVCICYTAYTTRGPRKANTVICAVKHGEKPNIYGRWKADNPLHYRTILSIDFREDRYIRLRESCPLTIADLRNTRTYRL